MESEENKALEHVQEVRVQNYMTNVLVFMTSTTVTFICQISSLHLFTGIEGGSHNSTQAVFQLNVDQTQM